MSKRVRVILLIISIIAIVALATYAWIIWNSPNNTELTMQIGNLAEVKFTKGNDISTSDMGPVLNPETDGEITTFSVKSRIDEDFSIDINLNITSIANELKSESLKYMILSSSTENGTYTNILSGNFANMVVGNNLLGKVTITSKSSNYFKFILYIDGTMENNTNMMGKALNGTLDVRTSAVVKQPNSPALVDGLIPVKYDETNSTWVKADSANTNNDWYNYDEKKWANAVLVSSTNRSTYVNGNAGTVIPESDVLAYYVWIPRYKYKVWNKNKEAGTDSYDAYHTGIDILFEEGKQSTGTISCTYDFSVVPDATHRSETCTGSNGDYYTHPAFTFGNDELTGIWVGKFEMGNEVSKPNDYYELYNTFGESWSFIYNIQSNNNKYGLNTSRSNTDSHMMKSLERGAVFYLTNSKYGRCNNNVCTEPALNAYIDEIEPAENEYGYMTGCGPLESGSTETGNVCNAYNTALGKLASTTGNIYGIYDLNGGKIEFVMGNASSTSGSYTYNTSSDYDDYIYSGNEKYVDTYAMNVSDESHPSFNGTRLGDAIGELFISIDDTNDEISNVWYYESSYLWSGMSEYIRWLNFDSYNAYFGTSYDEGIKTSRATLVSLQ